MLLSSIVTFWRAAIIALGVAAAIPTHSGDVRSRAHPARTFAEAVQRAQARVAVDDSVAAPGGATILLAHGARAPRAVVLFHGFTDSPRQFAALAQLLFERGDNVLVPRLPHHAERGRNASELRYLTASQLCHAADSAIDVAAGLGDTVVLAGLSVGGSLAMWAAERRNDVRRVVAIAPALEPTHVPPLLDRPLVNLGAHVPNFTRRSAPDSARPDLDPGFATHGLAAVLELGLVVREDAARYAPRNVDVAFVTNAHDHTVQAAPVNEIAQLWSTRGVPSRVYEIPDSLELPHSFVDPASAGDAAYLVTPMLAALIDGEPPPRWLARR